MAYDRDPNTLEWFRRALSSSGAHTRMRAVELLRDVDGPLRLEWLSAASDDRDPRVAATAVLVSASIEASAEPPGYDLFESDFADGIECDSLEWEWEYSIVVCRDLYAPAHGVLVWTREEDDVEAKRLAILKACVGQLGPGVAVPIIVAKRFANRYTRSARSFSEATRWRDEGRPRFREQD